MRYVNVHPLLNAMVGLEGGYEIPTWIKIALAIRAIKGQPVPAKLVYWWLTQHSETRLRTAARRCPAEFQALFVHRYAEQYGEGLRVKPNRTPISVA